MTKRHKMP